MAFDPDPVLKPSRCDPNLKNFAKSGPSAGTGRSQRILSDAGYWCVTYEYPVNTAERIRAFRVYIAKLRSGEEVNAPIHDKAAAAGGLSGDAVAELGAAAELRDTQITITATGAEIKAGMLIGIEDRLYQVTEIVSGGGGTIAVSNPISGERPWTDPGVWTSGEPAPVTYIVKVLPPMRADYADGSEVKLRGITMLGVLDELADGDLNLDHGKRGTVSFIIRESI